jgi:hypothetical protein
MATTYGQEKANVLKAVRRIRQIYRTADTAGEKLQRELNRVLKRKTLVSVATLQGVQKLIEDYQYKASALDAPLNDAMVSANSVFQ